jgi:hypothetical protein
MRKATARHTGVKNKDRPNARTKYQNSVVISLPELALEPRQRASNRAGQGIERNVTEEGDGTTAARYHLLTCATIMLTFGPAIALSRKGIAAE